MRLRLFILASLCFSLLFYGWGQGSTDTNFLDKKGRKQGYWKSNDPNRKLNYSGYFKDDRPEGEFIYTDAQDRIKVKAFFFRDGYASYNQMFDDEGNLRIEGYYLDKLKDSTWKIYNAQGKLLKIENYRKNLQHGTSYIYNTDGELLERQEWYRGLRHGERFNHEENGYQLCNYHLNYTNGDYYALYPDSTLFIHGYYDLGNKEKLWSFYLPSKNLYKQEFYMQNRLMYRILYVSIQGEIRPISMDTVAAVYKSPKGRAELLTQSSSMLRCDDKFETVCKIFDLDCFFYANTNTFVSFRFVEKITEERNASLVQLKVSVPYPIYADENGIQTYKNTISPEDVEAE